MQEDGFHMYLATPNPVHFLAIESGRRRVGQMASHLISNFHKRARRHHLVVPPLYWRHERTSFPYKLLAMSRRVAAW